MPREPKKHKPIDWSKVPPDQREYYRAKELDLQDEKKEPEEPVKPLKSPMNVMADMNEPSPISRAMHAGMTKVFSTAKKKVEPEDAIPIPAGMAVVRDKLPPPVYHEQDNVAVRELKVARRQIELDAQEIEGLHTTIKKLKEIIADLEKRPIITEDIQLELAAYHRYLRKSKERERRYVERHSQD
jgi:hypothetical protein